jgi:FkbM family methyltransferase
MSFGNLKRSFVSKLEGAKNFRVSLPQENEAERFLTVLYNELFGRTPDVEGIQSWLSRIHGGLALSSVLESFLKSEEFKKNLPKLLARSLSDIPFVNSFSQFQEDQILICHIISAHFENPYVVDIGAHSTVGSNSFVFSHHLHWPTLLVEANKELIDELKQNFPKGTTVLNTAVGVESGFVKFFVSDNDFVSSTNRQQAEHWGFPTHERKVPIQKIGDVLVDANVPIDFALLTIDIEGSDMVVLNDLLTNSNYRPRYIIVEISYDVTGNNQNYELPDSVISNYEVIAKTHANLLLKFLEER